MHKCTFKVAICGHCLFYLFTEYYPKLRDNFTTHGPPEVLVSDNGSTFTSDEFEEFMTGNGIQHVTTAPNHPSSNGKVEMAVQTLEGNLRKS